MAIQWYPGHMHKAQKQIREIMPKIDLIIEVLDARIPYSSENPMIRELRNDTPSIKVLNKTDLADPVITNQWIEYFSNQKNIQALAVTMTKPSEIKQLIKLCRSMLPNKGTIDKPINAMICGIPNVGKSTIINTLAGKIIAKTGNEPAVTKSQQKIRLEDGFNLTDTPGILWHKFYNENTGYRLAVTGAIKDTAMDYDDVGAFLAEYLISAYPNNLIKRYNLDYLPDYEIDFLEQIGKIRGCLSKGGHVNFLQICKLLISELRDGSLGQITLETPEITAKEQETVALLLQEKAQKEPTKKKKRKRRN